MVEEVTMQEVGSTFKGEGCQWTFKVNTKGRWKHW